MIGTGLPRPVLEQQAERWMRMALDVAKRTPVGNVPVGAVVVDASGRVVGEGCNERESTGDPTAHAEVIALRKAARKVGDGWRLENHTLVVTLEPCVMCAGAAVTSRIGGIIFGAYEPKTGACGSVVDVVRDPAWPFPPVAVRGGVLERECQHLVEEFFSSKRHEKDALQREYRYGR